MDMKFERYHWRHYFGGVALVLLTLQLLTGVFLTLFYQPHLKEAYDSVRYLYNHFPTGAVIRDGHRWIALFLMVAMIIHSIRSLFRRDFNNPDGTVLWVTGSMLILPLLAFLATGFILPWEWRAYWFMEMIPNIFQHLPVVGPTVKQFLLDAFTMNRAFVAHVVILPFITFILVDYHILAKTRKKKRGLLGYLLRHSLLALPFFIAIGYLVATLPMPTQDPDIIPMPLEGTDIPTVEWFLLVFWLPFLHFKSSVAPLFGLYLPIAVFLLLAALPFYMKARREGAPEDRGWKVFFATTGTVATVVILFGLMFVGTRASPTMGCNSCHNTMLGVRMGIPPESFKDHNIVPLLDDEEWMTLHWFYPQRVW